MKSLFPISVLLLLLLFPASPVARAATADEDWAAVTQAETGARPRPESVEEFRRLMPAYLEGQERALRHFITHHPTDPRVIDARLRLAHVLAGRGELTGQPVFFQHARQVIEGTARIAPESRQADVAFASFTLAMRQVTVPTEADRRSLSDQLAAFRRQHPNDRRLAALMTEIATLYDAYPREKEKLLQAALPLAREPALQARIHDDLRRLGMLGRPVPLSGTTPEGVAVDLAAMEGKVVLLYFFAGWSVPSVVGLQELAQLEARLPAGKVAIVGVSLDRSREELEAIFRPLGRSWPVLLETQGWESPLVRRLAVNALPTLWIIDRKGRLRTLKGGERTEAVVKRLLEER